MDSYQVWLYLHVLMFVYWLGADLGVFTLALAIRNPNYSVEQRILLMRMSLLIDMTPRAAMALIAPVGLVLGESLGLVSVPGWLNAVIWVIAFAWIAGEIVAFRNMGTQLMVRIYMGTGTLFVCIFLACTWFGIQSLRFGEPFATNWLALKVLLFGQVFLVSALMALFYAPVEAIFRQMEITGSSPELEARVRTQVNRGAIVTVVLFLLLATIAFLGQAKPG
ncbi:MAG: hypothetical protein CL799_13565 [Chromatiales bacterium]|jgi:hypothetical protein|nr:hypothetical protein [Chromatiales bacterium]MDP6151058.1 hypothetical protein [Gammaproteobacteria bacterium]MDP7093298.1 hypothetical protein [Gammaproteobacteria bacterium]MDP7271171.1 hypothetical protein [Gammaproteobacteria bacterium]HJP04262.1 hypothetical protein [Gammaproteobacteria bacterium]